jgi:DnaJ domain
MRSILHRGYLVSRLFDDKALGFKALSSLRGEFSLTTPGDRNRPPARVYLSSSTKRDNFQLDALPFTVSPEDALNKFREWAETDQGLKYLLSYSSIRIGAAYVPVWSFDLNVRFGSSWKPPMFSIYEGNTLHIPGLATYAGYSYRRSLINPVHSTSLVFLGDETQPFGGWMLRDMILQETKASISVVPDAWNATQARSFHVVTAELQAISDNAWTQDGPAPRVQTEIVRSRRVFMPTFVIDYKIMGLDYRSFISGCDTAAPVTGTNHRVFGDYSLFESPEFHQQSRNFLSWSSNFLRVQNLPFLMRLFRPAFTVVWFGVLRIWAKIPIIGAATGVVAGYRKILQPWMDNRTATADWERQRENEARMEEEDVGFRNDFTDSGAARQFFQRNRRRILDHLGGSHEHKKGAYDWYAEWEEWANQQWQQQRTHQGQSADQRQGDGAGQTYQRHHQQKAKQTEFHWDFDMNDPYSVLGIRRGATKQEVSAAFRKQMLKHHPDTQPNATEAQKIRLVERSKLTTEAYRRIKKDMQ